MAPIWLFAAYLTVIFLPLHVEPRYFRERHCQG